MATTPVPQVPPAISEAYALNLKLMVEETIKDLAELRDNHEALALKTLTDSQAAANVHLLNTIDACQKLSQATALNLATLGGNVVDQQAQVGALSSDDLAKITQSVTAAVTAVLSNMATGRPPVSEAGTVKT